MQKISWEDLPGEIIEFDYDNYAKDRDNRYKYYSDYSSSSELVHALKYSLEFSTYQQVMAEIIRLNNLNYRNIAIGYMTSLRQTNPEIFNILCKTILKVKPYVIKEYVVQICESHEHLYNNQIYGNGTALNITFSRLRYRNLLNALNKYKPIYVLLDLCSGALFRHLWEQGEEYNNRYCRELWVRGIKRIGRYLSSISRQLNATTYCEACGTRNELVWHHWYDIDTNKLDCRYVCPSCNTILTADRFNIKKNHYLPKWDIQKAFINDRRQYVTGRR